MKRFKTLIVLAIIIVAGAFLWSTGEDQVNISSDVFHQEIYENASGTWNPQMTTSHFRAQTIQNVEFGSSTTFHVEWTKPEMEYNHFVLTISDPESDWFRKESGEHDRVTLDLDQLEPAHEYVMVMQACLDPNCKSWYVSETEVVGAPSPMYWQLDGEGSTDTFVTSLYEEGDEDIRPELPTTLSEDNTVLYWPDGSMLENELKLIYIDSYDQDIVYEDGYSYVIHVIFNELDEPVASATLLNP